VLKVDAGRSPSGPRINKPRPYKSKPSRKKRGEFWDGFRIDRRRYSDGCRTQPLGIYSGVITG